MERIIFKPRELQAINWDSPRYSVTLQAGESAVMTDRWTNGGLGFLTELGVLWVPAGANNDAFYYTFVVDGVLVEKILRVIGAGGSLSSTTGSPTPMPYNPPLQFHRHMQITCFNNDITSHVGEVYAGGYYLYKHPNT